MHGVSRLTVPQLCHRSSGVSQLCSSGSAFRHLSIGPLGEAAEFGGSARASAGKAARGHKRAKVRRVIDHQSTDPDGLAQTPASRSGSSSTCSAPAAPSCAPSWTWRRMPSKLLTSLRGRPPALSFLPCATTRSVAGAPRHRRSTVRGERRFHYRQRTLPSRGDRTHAVPRRARRAFVVSRARSPHLVMPDHHFDSYLAQPRARPGIKTQPLENRP